MLPDRVSNPGPLTYESGALPIALRGPAPAHIKNVFGAPLGQFRDSRNWQSGVPNMLDRFGWLVVFGLNDPLRQYFSLYRVVSQREGERKEKG